MDEGCFRLTALPNCSITAPSKSNSPITMATKPSSRPNGRLLQQPALMFAVKGFDQASVFWFSPGAVLLDDVHGRGRAERRRLSKLSCAGWLPHDRGFVLELPLSRRRASAWAGS